MVILRCVCLVVVICHWNQADAIKRSDTDLLYDISWALPQSASTTGSVPTIMQVLKMCSALVKCLIIIFAFSHALHHVCVCVCLVRLFDMVYLYHMVWTTLSS